FRPVAGRPLALVLGNEVFGVDDEVLALCDAAVEIPQLGTKHSLNVSPHWLCRAWRLRSSSKKPRRQRLWPFLPLREKRRA
nr:hypothetical protein [Tanacetum cinerariifolium]